MLHVATFLRSPPLSSAIRAAAENREPSLHSSNNRKAKTAHVGFGGKKKEPVWKCVQNCGACCKLDKGPYFPSPEEIFEDPSDVELYKSLVGPDGWCIHYDKSSRKCSIYAERPYFCRVDPEVFDLLYGIEKKKFNKEACRLQANLNSGILVLSQLDAADTAFEDERKLGESSFF